MVNYTNQRGFSLIELLIVIAIIGLIAALAIPSLAGARAAAQQSSAVSTLRTMSSAQATFMAFNSRYGRLDEINQLNSNNLGQQAGPTLRKSGYVFQMVPTAPSNAQLANQFTIAASGQNPDGTTVIFQVDESGTISQIAP